MARKRDVPRENDAGTIDINDVIEEKQARRSFVTGRRLIIIAVVIVLAVFATMSIRDIQALRLEAEKAEAELALKKEQKANLEAELARLHDPAYIQKQARERLRMVKKDEIIYIYKSSVSSNSVDDSDGGSATGGKAADGEATGGSATGGEAGGNAADGEAAEKDASETGAGRSAESGGSDEGAG